MMSKNLRWVWVIIVVVGSLYPIGMGPVTAQIQFFDKTSVLFPPDPLEYTNQLTIGDIDNDGDLDILFANGGNFSTKGDAEPVRIYINSNGMGTFVDETVSRGDGVIGHFRGVELGDVERDGDLDIILASDFAELPRLLINDGLGFFNDETGARLPNIVTGSPRAQFGDIDNDGDLDLYIANGGTSRWGCGQNKIYINDGLGFYTDETATRHPLLNVCEPQDCNFGDIDGDFDLDVRTSSTGSNQSKLYRNDGTGVFTTVTGVPSDQNCYAYEFGDIEGDGDIDLLGVNANGSGNNSELLLINDGAGTYTDGSSKLSPNPSADDNDARFFDYDNDSDLDLIVARLGGTAERIYNNDGNGNFTEVTGLITANSDSSLDIKVGDLTGDGRIDIVTAQGESGSFINRIYRNIGPKDTFAPTVVRMEQLADTKDTAGPYVVRAVVVDQMTSDRNFFDRGIDLNFTVDGGPADAVAMNWVGGQVYRGAIPGQAGGLIEYFITAEDFANNMGAGPSQFFTVIGAPDCDGDSNGDGAVDPLDVGYVQSRFGCSVGTGDPECDAADQNADGVVDPSDSGYVLTRLGLCE